MVSMNAIKIPTHVFKIWETFDTGRIRLKLNVETENWRIIMSTKD